MNETTTLKYGGGELSLTKSSTMIGLATHSDIGTIHKGIARTKWNAPDTLMHVVSVHDDYVEQSNELLDEVRRQPEVAAGTHVYHSSPDDSTPFVPTGEVFVRVKDAGSMAPVRKVAMDQHLELVSNPSPTDFIFRVTSSSPNPVKTAYAFQQLEEVAVAEPDLATPTQMRYQELPTEARLVDQWHLHNTGEIRGSKMFLKPGADARILEAWDRLGSFGSENVVIAIIDDGFDLEHPDLKHKAIRAPWDFARRNNKPLPDPRLADWHGTACAGVACGEANGVGIVGAAPGCALMPIRMAPTLSDRHIEEMFRHITTHGAAIVSCSWGADAKVFRLSTRMKEAIRKCARRGRHGKGTVVIFAAGNKSHDIGAFPTSYDGFAMHPDVIAVAASTSMDEAAHYSNFGANISICAPSSGAGGRPITTADVMGSYMHNGELRHAGYSPGAYTRTFGGTSSACPLVAGAAGLLLSADPDLTATDVRTLLERTARQLKPAEHGPDGHSTRFGYGCLNAAAAIECAINGVAPLIDKKGANDHQRRRASARLRTQTPSR